MQGNMLFSTYREIAAYPLMSPEIAVQSHWITVDKCISLGSDTELRDRAFNTEKIKNISGSLVKAAFYAKTMSKSKWQHQVQWRLRLFWVTGKKYSTACWPLYHWLTWVKSCDTPGVISLWHYFNKWGWSRDIRRLGGGPLFFVTQTMSGNVQCFAAGVSWGQLGLEDGWLGLKLVFCALCSLTRWIGGGDHLLDAGNVVMFWVGLAEQLCMIGDKGAMAGIIVLLWWGKSTMKLT